MLINILVTLACGVGALAVGATGTAPGFATGMTLLLLARCNGNAHNVARSQAQRAAATPRPSHPPL
jgi:hypothetical protein